MIDLRPHRRRPFAKSRSVTNHSICTGVLHLRRVAQIRRAPIEQAGLMSGGRVIADEFHFWALPHHLIAFASCRCLMQISKLTPCRAAVDLATPRYKSDRKANAHVRFKLDDAGNPVHERMGGELSTQPTASPVSRRPGRSLNPGSERATSVPQSPPPEIAPGRTRTAEQQLRHCHGHAGHDVSAIRYSVQRRNATTHGYEVDRVPDGSAYRRLESSMAGKFENSI